MLIRTAFATPSSCLSATPSADARCVSAPSEVALTSASDSLPKRALLLGRAPAERMMLAHSHGRVAAAGEIPALAAPQEAGCPIERSAPCALVRPSQCRPSTNTPARMTAPLAYGSQVRTS